MTSYRDSGVDIDAQDEALREVRHIARGTFTPDVVSDIGSFGGLFRASFGDMAKPILVSSTDGVGTKLRDNTTSANPIILKVNMDAGHGGSSGRYNQLKETAFDYAWMLSQWGITK